MCHNQLVNRGGTLGSSGNLPLLFFTSGWLGDGSLREEDATRFKFGPWSNPSGNDAAGLAWRQMSPRNLPCRASKFFTRLCAIPCVHERLVMARHYDCRLGFLDGNDSSKTISPC